MTLAQQDHVHYCTVLHFLAWLAATLAISLLCTKGSACGANALLCNQPVPAAVVPVVPAMRSANCRVCSAGVGFARKCSSAEGLRMVVKCETAWCDDRELTVQVQVQADQQHEHRLSAVHVCGDSCNVCADWMEVYSSRSDHMYMVVL